MGLFDTYCALCSGPLVDAYVGWHDFVMTGEVDVWPPGDGKWRNPPGYPVPSKEIGEIIRISQEDGKCWEDWVCLSPSWPEYVSDSCEEGIYGSIIINGVDMTNQIGRTVRLHRTCLSLFCGFTNSTPQSFYESLYGEQSDYCRYGEDGVGLLYCLDYFDMHGRKEQFFAYALTRRTERKNDPGVGVLWDDPDTMEECNWLLARPNVFPVVASLPNPLDLTSTTNSVTLTPSHLETATIRVLHIPELLDCILLALIEPVSKKTLFFERFSDTFVPASVDCATRAVFALFCTSKRFYDHIIICRQDIFLSLAWQHAWMLPCTALDDMEWNKSNPTITLSELTGKSSAKHPSHISVPQSGRDWRTYLLTFLRKNAANAHPHIKNRWRMYRMALQCAKGKKRAALEDVEPCIWNCGDAGHTPVLCGSRRLWELPPAVVDT